MLTSKLSLQVAPEIIFFVSLNPFKSRAVLVVFWRRMNSSSAFVPLICISLIIIDGDGTVSALAKGMQKNTYEKREIERKTLFVFIKRDRVGKTNGANLRMSLLYFSYHKQSSAASGQHPKNMLY